MEKYEVTYSLSPTEKPHSNSMLVKANSRAEAKDKFKANFKKQNPGVEAWIDGCFQA